MCSIFITLQKLVLKWDLKLTYCKDSTLNFKWADRSRVTHAIKTCKSRVTSVLRREVGVGQYVPKNGSPEVNVFIQ